MATSLMIVRRVIAEIGTGLKISTSGSNGCQVGDYLHHHPVSQG